MLVWFGWVPRVIIVPIVGTVTEPNPTRNTLRSNLNDIYSHYTHAVDDIELDAG